MKKLFYCLFLFVICTTILTGCGESIPKEELKYRFPHNIEIKLNASKEEIIEKDKLFEQQLDPYQKIYVSTEKTSIGGIEFNSPKYFLDNSSGLSSVTYISMGDAKNKFETLQTYFNQLYYDNGTQGFYFITFETGEKYELILSYYLTSINPVGVAVEIKKV